MGLDLQYIDGQTPIDEDEKYGLKIKSITTRNELNEWEQLNIEDAIKWTLGLKKDLESLICEDFIKKLHKQMYSKVWKWAGEFRNSNKNIGVDKYVIGIELKKLCDDFIFWHQNNVFSSTERVLRFKHRLVSIHCFPNGNGRHSRLMADILIEKLYGQTYFKWGSANLSSASNVRADYLKALRNADKGNYDDLLSFATSD